MRGKYRIRIEHIEDGKTKRCFDHSYDADRVTFQYNRDLRPRYDLQKTMVPVGFLDFGHSMLFRAFEDFPEPKEVSVTPVKKKRK